MQRTKASRRTGPNGFTILVSVVVACLLLAGCSTDASTLDTTTPSAIASGDAQAVATDEVADEGDGGHNADSDPVESDFSVLDALRLIPLSATDGVTSSLQVSVADVDAAADQARLRRPVDPNSADQLFDFISPLSGFSRDRRPGRVFVPFPQILMNRSLTQVDEFVAEVGFSPGQVTRFAALESPPAQFVVLGGVSGPEGLPAVSAGVGTLGEGDDFAIALDGVTPARRLGRPLRVAERDGHLALSLATPPIAEWVDGNDTATLADNELLASVANRLDEEAVVSAALFLQESFAYQSVGLGWRADERGPQAVIVLHYDTASTALAELPRVEAGFDAESLTAQLPVADLVELVDIEVRGSEIVAVVTFPNDRDPITIFQMFIQRDVPFAAPA